MLTFNRTSMESKHLYVAIDEVDFGYLLIEPVWNRNCPAASNCSWMFSLLIEPVWNRNSNIQVIEVSAEDLLIEPVWNRNHSYIDSIISTLPF